MFFVARREVLSDRNAVGIGDVFNNLLPQCANADRHQSAAKLGISLRLTACLDELVTEGGGIPEDVFVDHADQPVQLHQRVLEGSRRQEQLVGRADGVSDAPGHLALRLEDVSQAMGFVDHDQIPRDIMDALCIC